MAAPSQRVYEHACNNPGSHLLRMQVLFGMHYTGEDAAKQQQLLEYKILEHLKSAEQSGERSVNSVYVVALHSFE